VRRKFSVAIVAAGLVAASLVVVPAMAATQAAPPTAQQLLTRAKKHTTASKGNYKSDDEKGVPANIPIYKAGTAFTWTADMDVDCDGIAGKVCKKANDPWYQGRTSFKTSKGKWFSAEQTHYYVIPLWSDRFDYRKHGIKPGSIAAIIYKGKVLYAVFADEGPSNIIGEASYLTAKDLGINPDPKNGGTDGPVTYIVFPGVVPSPVENNTAITNKGIAAAQAWLKS
jgi:hypothetical protein